MAQTHKDNASIVMLEHKKYPKLFLEKWAHLWNNINEYFPDVWKATAKGYPPFDYMDSKYKTWKRKKKVNGKTKARHLCKVSSAELIHIQSSLTGMFPLPSHGKVYSYKKGLKCSDCAAPHVGAFALYKLDISDFFYSITREMIYELYYNYFKEILSKHPASITSVKASIKAKMMLIRRGKKLAAPDDSQLSHLCRAIAVLTTRSDPRGVNKSVPVLPIGTIPASNISNSVLLPLDDKFSRMCSRKNITYTRYSDNMFFSAATHIDRDFQQKVTDCINDFEVAGHKGFKVNNDKTRYSARWRQHRILGMVTNTKLNVPKGKEKFLRSALNHLYYDMQQLYSDIECGTKATKQLRNDRNTLHRRSDRIFGQLAHIYQISPDKYKKYSTWMHAIKMLRDEIQLMLNVKAEQEALAKTAGGK